jgi:Ferredoxin-like domain in Api92-like protein
MPNWCQNSLILRHPDPACLDRVVKAYKAERLMSEFLPCPPALLAETEIGEDYNERVAAKEAANLAEHSHKDWYSWCMENWGTKWDISASEWDDADRVNDQVTLSFETAWQPPVAFYEHLTTLGYDVTVFYLEEGQGFVGKYTNDTGDDSFNFDGAEDLEDIPDDIREFWDLDTICEWREESDLELEVTQKEQEQS